MCISTISCEKFLVFAFHQLICWYHVYVVFLYIYCTSLAAQMVKNPPAMQETWAQSLGWEDPLEEGMATHSSIPAWRFLMDREAWKVTVHGATQSDTTERINTYILAGDSESLLWLSLNQSLKILFSLKFRLYILESRVSNYSVTTQHIYIWVLTARILRHQIRISKSHQFT